MTQSEFFEIARIGSPLLAAVLAGGVAWRFGSIQAGIARQQASTAAASAETARNKLRLDLFDRRLKIYDGIEEMITNIVRSRKIEIKDMIAYHNHVQAGQWLFGTEVSKYLKDNLWDVVRITYNHLVMLEKTSDANERAEIDNKISDALMILQDHREKINTIFSPYLHFPE